MVSNWACPGQVCCRQKDYWQFVKDIRWLSPGSARHLEKVGSGGLAGRGEGSWAASLVGGIAAPWLLACGG